MDFFLHVSCDQPEKINTSMKMLRCGFWGCIRVLMEKLLCLIFFVLFNLITNLYPISRYFKPKSNIKLNLTQYLKSKI